jgi:hypothetical protein
MAEHISQTITYSVDLLQGDYAQSIVDYDLAESHMDMMADTLTHGIIAQFRRDFPGSESPAARRRPPRPGRCARCGTSTCSGRTGRWMTSSTTGRGRANARAAAAEPA